MDVWTPVLNEELILKSEPTNDRDSNAVAVKKEVIVGHVPFNLAPFISPFLRCDTNNRFAKVVGDEVNREWLHVTSQGAWLPLILMLQSNFLPRTIELHT